MGLCSREHPARLTFDHAVPVAAVLGHHEPYEGIFRVNHRRLCHHYWVQPMKTVFYEMNQESKFLQDLSTNTGIQLRLQLFGPALSDYIIAK